MLSMAARLVGLVFDVVSSVVDLFTKLFSWAFIRVTCCETKRAETEQNCNKWLFHFHNTFISQPPE